MSNTLDKLATEFGQKRIDNIQQLFSYCEDTHREMKFLNGYRTARELSGLDDYLLQHASSYPGDQQSTWRCNRRGIKITVRKSSSKG